MHFWHLMNHTRSQGLRALLETLARSPPAGWLQRWKSSSAVALQPGPASGGRLIACLLEDLFQLHANKALLLVRCSVWTTSLCRRRCLQADNHLNVQLADALTLGWKAGHLL